MVEIILISISSGIVITWMLFNRINRQEKHPHPIINFHYKSIKIK
jgi:hypothetical protein